MHNTIVPSITYSEWADVKPMAASFPWNSNLTPTKASRKATPTLR